MVKTEFQIQSGFVKYVRLFHPGILFTISPAGFIMSTGMAIKMASLGYTKGTPDWLCFEPRGKYHGMLIEFKKPGGVPSSEQLAFLNGASARGYMTKLTDNVDDAIAGFEAYLKFDSSPIDL